MMPIQMSSVLLLVVSAGWVNSALAQSRTSSTGGVSQLTPTQATSLSNSAGGTTGSAGTTGGTSAGSTRAGGTSGQSQMGTGNEPQFNAADGSVGAQIGQNGFTGRTNTGFAGNRNAGQGASAGGLTPQFNQVNNSQTQGNRGNTGSTNVKRARPQQKIAFTYPKANLTQTRLEISERFKRLETVAGADTTISDEGIATLSGMVKDEESRKLAEALTRLEPGVRSVLNQLQVENPSVQ